MSISDRLMKLEARAGADSRRRQQKADANEFLARISRLAEQCPDKTTTLAEFHAAIRDSSDPFLVTTFLGDQSHAHQ